MAKKHVYNKSTGRDYKYDTKYQSSPSQRRKRSLRNKARALIMKRLAARHGKAKAKAMLRGKDIDHKRPLKSGGTNRRSNLRILSRSRNRGRK